tara:strand:+ start:22132 stop:22791 length:660 start_codon:yes stop_codon:yes gene_type:complete
MKITRINEPYPAISIDDFIPSQSLVRAAANSFEIVDECDWVKYGADNGQIQYCSKNRQYTPPAALSVLDYIACNFDPDKAFEGLTNKTFPDFSYYGGGMMITPNYNGEGGHLGMHVDADIHGINLNWKREYSAILCLSEEYDSSFDLLIHDGNSHARIPYKFNRLNVFQCSENSWHGVPEITKGFNRKTLGVMYWSLISEEERKKARTKAKFKYDLEFE